MINNSISWSQEKFKTAFRFAAEAHNGQLFPGTDLPYIMHLSFVAAEILACMNYEKNHDADFALQLALLHDTIEDTPITFIKLKKEFGEKIAQGVLALTKNKLLPKKDRIADSMNRIKNQPKEVWIVKLADRITNLAPPPPNWSKSRIIHYRKDSVIIHNSLKEASLYLNKRLENKINEYGNYIK